MKRRTFIAGLAGAVVLPRAAHAQERVRRVGVLMALLETDVEGQRRIGAFRNGLDQAGWSVGRNIRIDTRWTDGRPEELRRSADDLVRLTPDVILAGGAVTVPPLRELTRSIPIVFVETPDPMTAGFVASMNRPGRNLTGFARPETAIAGDWLAVLRQVAGDVRRVAVLRDPTAAAMDGHFAAVQSTAQSLGVPATSIDVRDGPALERAVAEFARAPGGVLVVASSPAVLQQRELIIGLALRHKLPAIYNERRYPAAGGLLSVGPDLNAEYRLAAGTVDQILKGERASEIPVRASVKMQIVINSRTAKAQGITIPPALVARADEVIE